MEVPIIAHKSTQEPSKKKGGFSNTLNRDVVIRQQEQSRELSEYAGLYVIIHRDTIKIKRYREVTGAA